jgi:acetyltransferase-like isoleucine patch superfamily enzyme
MHVKIKILNDNKGKHFLSPYTICVLVNGYVLEFKRGSYSAISSVKLYGRHKEGEIKEALIVGQFIERNHTTAIIVGGEHLTDDKQLINTFQTAEVIRLSVPGVQNLNSRVTGQTIIGDNVVCSANTTILNGAHISQNSLLAAGAVTNASHAPNSILAGIPAGKIGDLKLPTANWWNFSFDGIIDFLKTGNVSQPEDKCECIKIYFASSTTPTNTISNMNFSHLTIHGRKFSVSDLKQHHIDYLAGLDDEENKFLVSDEIFLDLIAGD